MKRKSQSSLEFLIIFGIGFIFIILLGAIFFNYSSDAQKSLDKKQIEKFTTEIINNVEKIYFLGSGNRVTIKTNFPDGIINFTIVHKNVSDPNNAGQFLQFDYIDIETYPKVPKSLNDTIHYIFEANKEYIRFNCTECYQTTNVGGNWSSYFNTSDFGPGFKDIKVENLGSFISIDFYKGQ